jgi:hypothetical protein
LVIAFSYIFLNKHGTLKRYCLFHCRNSNTACSVTRTSCLVQLVFTSPRKFSLVHPNRNIGEACCLIYS